jgi:hypothetical protein
MQTYQVKWCNHGVGRSTSNNTAQCTCCEVVRREEFNLLLRLHCAKFVRHRVDCQASSVLYRVLELGGAASWSRARLLLPERWIPQDRWGIKRQLREEQKNL